MSGYTNTNKVREKRKEGSKLDRVDWQRRTCFGPSNRGFCPMYCNFMHRIMLLTWQK
jgi:hypothetical protein